MKILIKCSSENIDYVYHCTKSEESAKSICENGFTGKEVDLSSSLYNAQGYGPVCIRGLLSDLLKLHIEDINSEYSFNLEDYPEGTQGLREPCNAELGTHVYYIFDIEELNNCCKFERYPKGDR